MFFLQPLNREPLKKCPARTFASALSRGAYQPERGAAYLARRYRTSTGDLSWALHGNRASIPVMPAISPPEESAQRDTTTRKPLLLFRFVGLLLFRFAERQFLALLFQ